MTTLFVDQLTVVDFAYLDVARGLVGESWIVDVELEGALDEQSMVLDFSEVKRRLKRIIDASVDHRLLVPGRASQLEISGDATELHLVFRSDVGTIEHQSPALAVCIVDSEEIDPGSAAAHLVPLIRAELPASVGAVHLRLRPELTDGAYYHYVHGLRKHLGACQRIAHGHRSRIEVFVDGRRDAALERAVASDWLDVYLGTVDDVVARGSGRVRFAYRSQEGHFQLALPDTHVRMLETDSTVECIAEWLAQRLAPERPGHDIRVRAFEGVMKGAIAERCG